MRIQMPGDLPWFFSSQSEKSFCVLNALIGADSQSAAAFFFFFGFRVCRGATLPLTLRLPATGLSELSSDTTTERRGGHLLLPFQTDRGPLPRVPRVALEDIGLDLVGHADAAGYDVALRMAARLLGRQQSGVYLLLDQ